MDRLLKGHFTHGVELDFFRMFCGDLIGTGVARTVYNHAQDPKLVVKIEHYARSFQNIIEWETWKRVEMTEHAKWFAPCVNVSPTGIVLIQKKTAIKSTKHYPERIPTFFTDTKYSNYGFLGRQLVCHDYGVHLLMEKGMRKTMRKADWWFAEDTC
jgi:hypothetical protein